MKIIEKILANIAYQKEKLKAAADNVARSNIPGAKEKYVKEIFSNMISLAQTQANHLGGTGNTSPFRTGVNRKRAETSLNGNAIDEEKQLAEAAEASTGLHLDVSLVTKVMEQQAKILNK